MPQSTWDKLRSEIVALSERMGATFTDEGTRDVMLNRVTNTAMRCFYDIADGEGWDPDVILHPANTRVRYLYRDSDNYKDYAEAILRGAITDEERAALVEAVGDEGLFEPMDVLLESAGDSPDDEHTANELLTDEITIVDRPPTAELTITEFVAALVAANTAQEATSE